MVTLNNMANWTKKAQETFKKSKTDQAKMGQELVDSLNSGSN